MPQLDLAKLKLKQWKLKDNMTIVLEEWGLTTDAAELKIGNRSKRDLDAENLNLHHEKM